MQDRLVAPTRAVTIACTFTGHHLERANIERDRPEWFAEKLADPAARFVAFSNLRPALVVTGALKPRWLTRDELGVDPSEDRNVVLLGTDEDGAARFAVDVGDTDAPEGCKFIDVRSAATQMAATGGPDPDVAAIGLGRTLLHWNAKHGFCSVCGERSRPIKGGSARRCTDTSCGAEHFARVDPVVIMLPTDADRCALGRQPRFPPGMYSALAGFVEPGESLEEAVVREVYEESHLRVTDVRYVASQPWPFPSSLMIGCIARAETFDIEPDRDELEDVRWFSREEIAEFFSGKAKDFFLPPPIAIAHQLIKSWVEGH